MNKTKISAKIVADSVSPQGDRLISVLCTFPRIILAEVNTHRMLSKNTSSSRAIPLKKMVEVIKNDPFIPIAWQKEHKGMQGTEYIDDNISSNTVEDESALYSIHRDWFDARDYALEQAERLNRNKLTKQLYNRLLEPFMWTTMLITGSREGWDNFFNLRCPVYYYAGNDKSYKSKKELLPILLNDFGKSPADSFWYNINKGQAEIHMMALAESIYDAINESEPKQLQAGEWHIPFIDKIDKSFQGTGLINSKDLYDSTKIKISTAMAARTSYTVVGDEKEVDYEKMIDLHDRLLAQDPPHSSPLEHCARAMSELEYTSSKSTGFTRKGKDQYGWCNNLKGFIPYRYMIDNKIEL